MCQSASLPVSLGRPASASCGPSHSNAIYHLSHAAKKQIMCRCINQTSKKTSSMPSENAPSQRPSLGGQRSTSSVHSATDSPSTSPAQQGKQKGPKHVVGARVHARVPSNKGLHKLTKAHGSEGSHTDLKKLGRNSSSTTSLKKNSSHVSLKRNRSSADVSKRPRSSHEQTKRPASVHFEIGDQEPEDGWESTSASPALSRSASRSASNQSSAKPSANNSQPQSPIQPPSKTKAPVIDGPDERSAHKADGKVITERLLQRTPSHNTTKMSLATATPTGQPSDSVNKSQGHGTLNSTPKIGSKDELVSRFVGGSGTPNSPFLNDNRVEHHKKGESRESKHEEVKRARSMGNLTQQESSMNEDEEESALAPRSRKSSTSHAYIPPQQSRTQQKLWLQRASSNIEPQQITPGAAINGLTGIHGGLSGSPLIGAGYDGRDPRIKIQLERTGLEYLVVRRHQDPVGKALKRLEKLPGMESNRRIPPNSAKKSGVGAGAYGLSQSLKESRKIGKDHTAVASGARSSYEGQSGSQDDTGMNNRANEDDGVGALLRSIWEKSFDLSASAD